LHREIINTVFTRAASTFLNFLIAVIIARHAGPAVKGDVTLLVTTVWFVVFISNILGGPVLVYVMPRSRIEKLLGPSYLWSFITSILCIGFLSVVPIHTAAFILPVAAIALLSSVVSIHQTVLLGKKEISRANLVSIVMLLIQTAVVVTCFYGLNIHDAYAYVYASIVAHAVAVICSGWYLKTEIASLRLSSFSVTEELKSLIKHGFMYQLVEVLQLLNLRYYFFQLGLQQGSKYLGIYSIGISILEAVWLIPRGISTVHYVSTSNSAEIKQEAQRTVSLTQLSLLVSGVALLIIWLVPAQVYVYIFGEGFADVRHSVRYLFPGILVYNLWLVISSFFFGTGNYKPLLVSNIAGVVSLIAFSAVLIPKYVMSGAGLSASLSFLTASVVLAGFFMQSQQISITGLFDFTGLKEQLKSFRAGLVGPGSRKL
jgi:O-antigen/teichoic acid export membrane protein